MSWTAEVLAQRDVWQWAPSAHNTQPGTLAADGDALIVGWDPACELPVSDPTRRDLWLSLGAFVEAVVIAAADLGIGLAVEWAVDPWANRVARLTRTAGVSTTYGGAELVGRRTARGPYRKPFVTEAEVGLLAERLAGSGLRLSVLPDRYAKRWLPAADRWSYSSPEQVAELRRWLRLDVLDPAYRRDGLNAECLGLPLPVAGLLRLALSAPSWAVLSRIGGPRLMATLGHIAKRGTVVVLHQSAEVQATPERTADAGRWLLRCWLAAARVGLSVHPLSQLIDSPRSARAIQSWLAATKVQRQALAVFRLGRPVHDPPRSHRRGSD